MHSSEHQFSSWDGTDLFFRHWKPEIESSKAIILFHRGHEHSGRWQDVVDKLDLKDTHIFAWDARGHGRSPGERGYATSFGVLVKDADCFVRHISATQDIPMENMVIFAHSVGSVLVSAWVHDYAPNIRGLILGSPALRVRLYIPFAIPALRLLQKVKKKAFISSYVKGNLLTHDPEKSQSYNEDPLITPQISVNILLGLRDAATRLMDDAAAITVPTLILSSGADFVVEQSAQRKFYNCLPHPRKEMQTFEGFRHDTFNELESHKPINKARMFIDDLFERITRPERLLEADTYGYTKDEHDRLAQPLPWWSPKKWSFDLTKMFLFTIGKLSKGIEIGCKTGFDSGSTLDYVYENQPRGATPIGRFMDKTYLNSPGWRGIRQRKINLEKFLDKEIRNRIQNGETASIVDIATGHGRYVLDVVKDYDQKQVKALLRDYSEINIDAGKVLATKMGLKNVSYEQGDAFNRKSLGDINSNPNIAIISGLYELFSDNSMIQQSLAGIYDRLEPGGTLIYTNQPWHPQLEFIARVLTSHREGSAWVMRRRTQAEMDQLVKAAGFEKLDQEIDEDGIFTVSLARKS